MKERQDSLRKLDCDPDFIDDFVTEFETLLTGINVSRHFRAGQLNCKLQKLYRSSKEVDVTLSTISVTIFEDISKFTISGYSYP